MRSAETGLLPLAEESPSEQDEEAARPAELLGTGLDGRRFARRALAACASTAAACALGASAWLRPQAAAEPVEEGLLQLQAASCSAAGADCRGSRCCKDASLTCFEKDEFWASCSQTCTPGVHVDDPSEQQGKGWSCKALSSGGSPASLQPARASAAASTDSVKLFCWSVVQQSGAEHDLVEEQRKRGISIFGCDQHMTISSSQNSAHGGSGDLATGSWTNVDIFIDAWRQVESDGRYLAHDWTVKVDPDAVFVPAKLRERLAARGAPAANGAYLNNCGTYEFGFFGALEVMSTAAVSSYLNNIDRCKGELTWQGWGEDLFAQKCMDLVGVSGENDFEMVADGNCGEAPAPCNTGRAAYHPYKILEQWLECYEEIESTLPDDAREAEATSTPADVAREEETEQEGEVPEINFDCDEGLNNFIHGWSKRKQDWCCEREQKGCTSQASSGELLVASEDGPATGEDAEPATAAPDRPAPAAAPPASAEGPPSEAAAPRPRHPEGKAATAGARQGAPEELTPAQQLAKEQALRAEDLKAQEESRRQAKLREEEERSRHVPSEPAAASTESALVAASTASPPTPGASARPDIAPGGLAAPLPEASAPVMAASAAPAAAAARPSGVSGAATPSAAAAGATAAGAAAVSAAAAPAAAAPAAAVPTAVTMTAVAFPPAAATSGGGA